MNISSAENFKFTFDPIKKAIKGSEPTGGQTNWLNFLTEDSIYEIPVRLSREDPAQLPYDQTLLLSHESKSFLKMRFARLTSDCA